MTLTRFQARVRARIAEGLSPYGGQAPPMRSPHVTKALRELRAAGEIVWNNEDGTWRLGTREERAAAAKGNG